MHSIHLESPTRSGNAAHFRWRVEPASPLYFSDRFALRFPDSVDVNEISESLLWRIALICLHSHWTLLRPCRVELPVRLQDGEAEFWMRLVDAEAATLDAHRGCAGAGREIEIREHGDPLAPLPGIPESRRSVSAFSGGKDSLLQAALLCEILGETTLVATTAPMPPMSEHGTGLRRRIFSEIAKRQNVSLVEVHSDFRSVWDNGFARRLGYPVWITEITDVFLYFAALMAVASARKAPHLFLASENEVQQTATGSDGQILQHTHFMYSVATQRALERLLRPTGITYSSTTSALRSSHVERLLRIRYRDLRDLQYSCSYVDDEGVPCSRCTKCFRAALSALAEGDSPAPLGIDTSRLIRAMQLWTPRDPPSHNGGALPVGMVSAELDRQIVRYLKSVSFRKIASAATGHRWRTLLAFARIRRRIHGRSAAMEPGYSTPFLAAADPLVRSGLESIFSEHFSADENLAAAESFERSDSLSRWVTQPIGGLN